MDLKAVGQRIKAAREAKNLTQEELAALVNLSTTHVSVIERGCQALLFEFLDGQIAVDFQNAPRLVMLDDESEIRIDVALSHGERRLLTLQQAQKPLRRKNGFPAVIHHRVFSVRQSQSPILLVVLPNGSYGD